MNVQDKAEERFAVAAFVISLIALVFTGLQWYEARAVRVDAREAAKIAREDAAAAAEEAKNTAERTIQSQTQQAETSARQAERSATAAERSASIAQQALHISERAFLDVAPRLSRSVAPNEKVHVTVVIKNAGRTPAHDVVGRAHVVVGYIDEDAAMREVQPPRQTASHIYLSPNATVEYVVETLREITPQEFDHLATTGIGKRLKIYVVGAVKYRDSFRLDHKSTFCFFYQPENKTFAGCMRHNIAS